ncbi:MULTISPECIES: heavy metal sensor histidine kinase [Burkholderia cepacia complex]|uniref:heavy metal sensor histidine kinase n=1 Tax=Burkholderia cepacia complex TaxID=87882 RepID=UPI0019087D68|nr:MULTISPECIES: heavy metal sensor histidine kinase [Burkholderia cepacia complex]MBJ9730082.1 heavy metal sensor histidine kinase [Burkholderia cenocepacia]MBK1822843.1 heavy metal sensor histidine kinase [Burkholderia orbicola]MBR8094416.1 heavy metal sensor histidine kinase [Burkholderia cenocepacia]MBR8395982.1 heavy metal sensor histidine kinase [Burkholderia cenocepacia]UJH75783.1 heavy metal sensor histidine kinase [Burkholderia cenocepacia]
MIARLLPRTLRGRLTALIILSTSVILASSGVALYEALSNRVETTAAEQMAGISAALGAHLAEARTTTDVARNPDIWVDQLHGHPNMDLAIFDAAGTRLVATPGFRPYAPLMSTNAGRVPVGIAPPSARHQYLLTTVPLAGAGAPVVRVAVQYDRSADVLLLRTHAYTIVVIEVFGVVLAAAIAYGIAALGLSPLRRFAARAEQMSSSRLAHPLPELDTSGELKELEHAFNGMLARLNESFTRLSQFSSNLAHDMRTPLTNLQAAAQVVLSQPRGADEYRSVIESSIDEYQRLSRMIEDMLFLARSEQAGTSIDVRRLNAAEEAERVAGYYEPLAEDEGVTVKVDGHAWVDADLTLYQRALSNLLSNALTYAPRGSVVTIDCVEQGGATTIAVSDTGPGIAAEHVGRIFERFYRVDPSRHNSASGTGLGLAIVRSIMDNHGGECGVDSEPGRRTTFWLRFPRRPAEPGRPAAIGT